MKLVRFLPLIILLAVAASWLSGSSKEKESFSQDIKQTKGLIATKAKVELRQKAAEAKLFTQRKGYNENICFLIDMNLASGQNRFFIYDLEKDSVRAQGLVAHGNCFEYWLEGRRYSNVVGSGCTSLGKYKIGASYTGKWGYSYRLHGLDSTNNNAFERTVVLHSHSCVPNDETTDEICQSNGCPTVAPSFLKQLKTIINNSAKPVLLWIYE